MKITEADRSLARELAELLDADEQTQRMLAVVLASHRQLPSEVVEQFCGIISPASGHRCVRHPSHHLDDDRGHQVADGRWFSLDD